MRNKKRDLESIKNLDEKEKMIYLPDILKQIPRKKKTVKVIYTMCEETSEERLEDDWKTLTGNRATGLYHNILRIKRK